MTLLVQGQRYTEILRQFLSGRKHSFSVSPFNFPLSPSLYALSTPVIYSHGPLAPMREICQMTVLYSFGLFQSGGGGGKWGGQKVECIFILSLTWLPHSRFLQLKIPFSFIPFCLRYSISALLHFFTPWATARICNVCTFGWVTIPIQL